MVTRIEQKEKRREEILEAALDVFIRKGYAATKIANIATEAGMSIGLLFHYFESKAALYEELIRMGVQGPNSMMDMLDKSNPIAYFETAAAQIFQLIHDMPFVAKMFALMNHACYSEGIPPKAKEMAMTVDFYTLTVPIIKAGQKDGSIREGNAYALSMAFWTAIQGVAEAAGLNPGIPLPESDWIVDIIRRKNK